jgi:ATP-dependent protease ClpP protease subunit
MLSKLEARLENKETGAIKQAGALVKEHFNTYQEELEYYAREKRGSAVWQKGNAEQTSTERVYTRTLNELNNLGAELNDPSALAKRIVAVLKEVESLRGNAVIAYFAAYGYNRNGVKISDEDLDPLTDMIEAIPPDVKKLDFIIHSPGGLLEPAVRIVKFLRGKFEEVNFLIPRNAYSAAAMMAMSANRIIMHDVASFSPYDPLTLSGSGEYLRTPILKIVAKDALKSFEKNSSNAMLAFPGWTKELARTRLNDAAISDVRYRRIAALWLVKYMFGHSHIKILDKCNAALLWSVLRALFNPRSRKDTLKAKQIVKFFTNIKLHLSHDDPLMYQDINDLGLNVSLASGELKDCIREAYLLNKAIFDHSQISKCWFSTAERLFSWWIADLAKPAV